MLNDRILIVPDIHFPYSHQDSLSFLLALKKRINPTRCINLGDEVDGHSWSFHQASAELDSPSAELEKAIIQIKELGKIFPQMDLMESNHGSLFVRKLQANYLPKKILKSYRDILEAPIGWEWHNRLIIKLPDGNKCMFVHSLGANVLQVSMRLGMCVVEGHHHNSFDLRYHYNGERLLWGMISGSLIADESIAYAYNKLNPNRPIIGASVIINSIPQLVPMRLNNKGRWTGVL
jgi:hypothetical protein